MRLLGLALGVCLCLTPEPSVSAPPVHAERDPDRTGLRARSLLAARERAPGLDQAEPLREGGPAGLYKAVVILLQFPDHPADTLGHTPADFADLLFSVGTRPTGSFRDYYREVSRGAFDIDGIVTRWYTAPQTYAYYVNGLGGFGSPPQNAQQMCADAVALADPDVDFAAFDNDGPDGIPRSDGSTDDDGVIDALFIVHAGPGGEETGSDHDIHSHKWTAPPSTIADGVRAAHYTTEPEEFGLTSPYSTPGDLITIGVFCHEFGHVLGLPDLYDLTEASVGIGEWDLMGHGVYTHGASLPLGSTPAHLSAWSKVALGWIAPTWVVQDSAGVSIPPVETSGQVFRLWTDGEDAGEYFLIENRQPVGFDSALVRSSIEAGAGPAHGLLVYHVNGSATDNNDPARKLVDVEEAGGPETAFGFAGAQNLDLSNGTTQPRVTCAATPNVTGNRGDRYDPWPGAGDASSFDPGSCPASGSICGGSPSHVAVRNIVEVAGTITADFFVRGLAIRRLALSVDDAPAPGLPNNGNGLAEPGETIRLRFPLQNESASATGPLVARLTSDPLLALQPDSAAYASIAPGASDSGTVVDALVLPAADPRGANVSIEVHGAPGMIDADSVQVLLGTKTGICESFESTQRRWTSVGLTCDGVNEWHREAGVNHTPGGTWAWRLGPQGLVGEYAATQDARLVSQPVRLGGSADTLVFWQRYDSEPATDGLTVEVSTDGAETWTMLVPEGGYSSGDRWTGQELAFLEARVPLTGYGGLVQIGFRFRSTPGNGGGLGWWIDDVRVAGTDECATTAIAITRFEAAPLADRPAIRLEWELGDGHGTAVGIDRAGQSEPRRRLVTLPWETREGSYEDIDVAPERTYTYWLTASREGEPDATGGPLTVGVPAGVGSEAPPRALALDRVRPNPFTVSATFRVSLDREGPFVVRVYRVDGSLVRTMAETYGRAETLTLTWDGTDDHGTAVGAGVYFVELRSRDRVRTQRAVLLR